MPRTKNLFPNIAAFLDLIAFSEGTNRFGNDDGYNVIVGGKLFTSYKDHPRVSVELPKLRIKSTAAGRYQLLSRYFTPYAKLLNLPDFSPESQDKIAMQQIKEQNAFMNIKNGEIKIAIEKCSNIWASFPGAGYGQREEKIENLLNKFVELGGTIK